MVKKCIFGTCLLRGNFNDVVWKTFRRNLEFWKKMKNGFFLFPSSHVQNKIAFKFLISSNNCMCNKWHFLHFVWMQETAAYFFFQNAVICTNLQNVFWNLTATACIKHLIHWKKSETFFLQLHYGSTNFHVACRFAVNFYQKQLIQNCLFPYLGSLR